MKNFVLGFLLASALISAGFFGYERWHSASAGAHVEKPAARYHCPMHTWYISDRPGNCPICGMKLVPMKDGSAPGTPVVQVPVAGAARGSAVPGYVPVTIPPDRIQMMGITVQEARTMDLDQSFRTYGRVTYNETEVHHVHTKFEGFIEELFVNFVGQYVKAGQALFTVYSPELYATQQEYLLALRAREQIPALNGKPMPGGVDLVAAARQRLSLWDIDESQIRELEKSRKPLRALTIFSPVSGYVLIKTVVHGMRIMPGQDLYDIVDLSTVWILADVYEVNLSSVRLGQPATVTLPYEPGRTWRGRVSYIDPTVDPATRTVKARLEIANTAGLLKPEMYAEVVIGGSRGKGVAVPESAIIATGERNIVFVARDGGVFEPRQVVLGTRVRNVCEIREGLAEGEKVVVGASFLLDSESRLKAAQ
jgi:membrane fusion protein, copper/silver efflux system